jgi:cyclic pyranopterin phosphate synthase
MTDTGQPPSHLALPHLDGSGHAHMVDVSGKEVSARSARASGRVG